MLIVWTVSDELRRRDLLTAGGQKRADKLHHRGGEDVDPRPEEEWVGGGGILLAALCEETHQYLKVR